MALTRNKCAALRPLSGRFDRTSDLHIIILRLPRTGNSFFARVLTQMLVAIEKAKIILVCSSNAATDTLTARVHNADSKLG